MKAIAAIVTLAGAVFVGCKGNEGPKATLAVDRGSVVMSVVPVPRHEALSITSSPEQGLRWTAVLDSSWVAVVPLSGVTPGTVELVPNGLARHAGSYEGHVTFTAAGASAPVVLPVALVVPDVTGSWFGSGDGGVTVAVTVVEQNGPLSGDGVLAGPGGSLVVAVTGTHSHPNITLVLSASGFSPAVFSGQLASETSLQGAVNGSGFTNWAVTLQRTSPLAGSAAAAVPRRAAPAPRRSGLMRVELGGALRELR